MAIHWPPLSGCAEAISLTAEFNHCRPRPAADGADKICWPKLLRKLGSMGLRAADLDAGNRLVQAYDAAMQPGAGQLDFAAYYAASAVLKGAVKDAMARAGKAVLAALSTGDETLAVVIVQLGTNTEGVELVKFIEPNGKSQIFPWEKFGIVHAALVEPLAEPPAQFVALLSQAHMIFRRPAEFSASEVSAGAGVACHHAITLSEPKLEIRYQIVPRPAHDPVFKPIASANTQAVPEMMLTALIANSAERVLSAPNPLPAEAVRAEFGADWGAVCRLSLKASAFGGGFRECLLLALYRQDMGSAFQFFLFDDFEKAKGAINDNFYTLTFETL